MRLKFSCSRRRRGYISIVPRPGSKMAKLLLVEDDKGLAMMIGEWLNHEHHAVEIVHDGKEGMDRLYCSEFDVAIIDWELPGMSGVDICKNYRAGGGSAGIIMLTGKKKIEE